MVAKRKAKKKADGYLGRASKKMWGSKTPMEVVSGKKKKK